MSSKDRLELFLNRFNHLCESLFEERFELMQSIVIIIALAIIILWSVHFVFIPFLMKFIKF